MKKNITLLALAVAAMSALFSCSKSSSSSSSTGSLSASVNGVPFNASVCTASITTGGLAVLGQNSTTTASLPSISLSATNYTGVGTYTFSISGGGGAAVDSASGNAYAVASYGTIVVTSASTTVVSGTFSFTSLDSTKVTGGVFTAKLP